MEPVLIVVQQHDCVALLPEKFVIVLIVARRQRYHHLQSDRMQRRSQLADKFPVVRLIFIWHLLEIDHDARLVRFHSVLHRIADQIRARRRIRQHLHHFLHVPRRAVVVVQHRHRRNFHVDAAHPLVQLVFPQPAVRFLRAHLHGFIPHVIHNC